MYLFIIHFWRLILSQIKNVFMRFFWFTFHFSVMLDFFYIWYFALVCLDNVTLRSSLLYNKQQRSAIWFLAIVLWRILFFFTCLLGRMTFCLIIAILKRHFCLFLCIPVFTMGMKEYLKYFNVLSQSSLLIWNIFLWIYCYILFCNCKSWAFLIMSLW